MHESIHAGQHFDEGTEVHDLLDLAHVQLADLDLLGDLVHPGNRLLGGRLVARGDRHGPVVLHIHFHAASGHDVADDFAAGTDDLADLLRLDLERVDPGRVGRHVRARRRKGQAHTFQDVQPPLARLRQGPLHELGRDPRDLDVHLQRRHALRRAADLEVHVAQMILEPQDIGDDHHLVTFFDQPHRDAGHGLLDGHAGIHEGQAPAADGRHRRGPVRLQDVRNQAQGVGELLLGREDRLQGALREGAMADLAAAWRAQRSGLTDAEGGEVIMQHEVPVVFALQGVDLLLIIAGAQRDDRERLCFPSREQRRAVRARQDAHFARDRPDVRGPAPVGSLAVLQDHLTDFGVLEVMKHELHVAFAIRVVRLPESLHRFRHDRIQAFLAGGLVRDEDRFPDLRGRECLHRRRQSRIDLLGHRNALGLAAHRDELPDGFHDLLDFHVRPLDRRDHHALRQAVRPAFHHHDGVRRPGHHQAQIAFIQRAQDRIDHKFPFQPAHAHSAHRSVEGDVGDRQRRRGRDDANHVGGTGLVRRDHRRDHLGLVVPALWEQRPHRPIDQATRELFPLRRLALAPEKAARNLARGIGFLLVVHGQRQEIGVLLGSLRGHRCGQHVRVAIGGQHRAIGLLGQVPGFQPKRAALYFEFNCLRHGSSLSFVL